MVAGLPRVTHPVAVHLQAVRHRMAEAVRAAVDRTTETA
jgi:hypothetical protein